MDTFDPAVPGTPECFWRATLAQYPEWTPQRGSLLVVSPHPDDEVLGAGGLMRTCLERGDAVSVVSVTDGEGAYPDWPGLKERRRVELESALSALSSSRLRIVRLSLPDGGGQDNTAAVEEAVASLCAHRPTLVAPYERDGHPDHESTGRACLKIARRLGLPIARYPIWAWHHRAEHDLRSLRFRRVVLDAAAQAAKAAAIACFTSQLAPGGGRAPIVPAHVRDYFTRNFEAFVL